MNIKRILDNSIRELNEGMVHGNLIQRGFKYLTHPNATLNRINDAFENKANAVYKKLLSATGSVGDGQLNPETMMAAKIGTGAIGTGAVGGAGLYGYNKFFGGDTDEQNAAQQAAAEQNATQQAAAEQYAQEHPVENAWDNGAFGMSPTMTQAGMIGIPAALLAGAGALALRRRQKKAQH